MTTTLDYTTLATFGASLTDWGGMYALTEDVIRVPLPLDRYGYAIGYSNGPVYTAHAADLLGISDLDNYAVGGAATLGTQTLEDFLAEEYLSYTIKVPLDDPRLQADFNYTAQVDRFLEATEGTDLSDTMSLIQMGLVDYMNFFPKFSRDGTSSYSALTVEIIDTVFDGVDRMFDAGVGKVVLNTLPDPSNFPFMSWMPAIYLRQVDAAVADHNAALAAEVALRVAGGQEIEIVDMHAITSAIRDDPTTFGFVAPENAYILQAGFFRPVSTGLLDTYDPDQVAFFDPFHPTTAYHGVMGIFEAESLTKTTVILQEDQPALTATVAEDLVLVRDADGAEVTALGGDDTVIGGVGDDTLMGGEGSDLLAGGSGNDVLDGGLSADLLAGGAGDDVLSGLGGDDVLIGGLGSDILQGGEGNDTFLFTDPALIGGAATGDTDLFDGGIGFDTLYLALGEAERAAFEATGNLEALGLSLVSVEEVVLLDSRQAFAEIVSDAPLAEADLWGLI